MSCTPGAAADCAPIDSRQSMLAGAPDDASRLRRLAMRNRIILSVVLLALASGLAWAQFWKGYSDAERQKVGEAYWLAGKQYAAIGKTEKGDEYMLIARSIFPGLDPAGIKDEALPSAAELLAQGRATAIGGGAESLPTAALSSFFLRFAAAIPQKDAAAVEGFLDGTVYLSGRESEVTPSEFAGFFADAPAEDAAPSALYDLASIVIAREAPAQLKAWGDAYTLTVDAARDLSGAVPIWSGHQQFFIHRTAAGWSIFAYGQAPPPLSWSPTPAGAAGSAAAPTPTEADKEKGVAETFTGMMSALLGKDADGVVARAGANVRFIRLRQSVTRDELKTSLQGIFDGADFKGAGAADVLDMGTLFVNAVASPVEGVTDGSYELNVQSREDLSSVIPFWSKYQKYYFAAQDGGWVMTAIF
jgi:hypothetical protein